MQMTTKIMLEKEILILLTMFGPQSILPFFYFHTGTFLFILPMKPLIFFLSNCCWHTAVMHHSARWALLWLTQELHPQLTHPSERGFSTWCSRSLCFHPCRETRAHPAKNPAEVNVSRQPGFPWGNWGVTALSSQGCQGGNDLQPSSRWEAKAATCAAKFTRAHLNMEPWSWHQWESSSDWREK